jgi:hypothetical protein
METPAQALQHAEAQLAHGMFRVWWYGLALTTAVSGLQHLPGAAGVTGLAFFETVTYANLLVVCVILWALVYYLVYLFTGWRSAIWPLAAFYVAYFVLLVYYIASSDPSGVEVTRWRVAFEYEEPLSGPLFQVVVAFLVLPQILGALAYSTLVFRVPDPTSRYRVTLVSWSIIVWFGSAYAAAWTGIAQNDWWQIASRAIGLAAALAILAAYRPPRFLQRRLGVVPVEAERAPVAALEVRTHPALGEAKRPERQGAAASGPERVAPAAPPQGATARKGN